MTTPNPTFDQVWQAYRLSQIARGLAPRYVECQDRVRRNWLQLHGDQPLREVTAAQVRTWLLWLRGQSADPAPARLELSQTSANQYLSMLKAYLHWAQEEEYIERSPAARVRPLKATRSLPDVLTEDEAYSLIEGVRRDGDRNAYRDYVILLFFLDTGVRLAELSRVALPEVNLQDGYARVLGKGRKERIVPLGLELRRVLAKYLTKYRAAAEGEQALFTNERGYRLGMTGIETLVKRALRKYVTRPLRRGGPHLLRHTFATMDLRTNRDIKRTSMKLGHASTTMTERYTHLTGDDILVKANGAGSHMDQILRRRS